MVGRTPVLFPQRPYLLVGLVLALAKSVNFVTEAEETLYLFFLDESQTPPSAPDAWHSHWKTARGGKDTEIV